MEINILLLAAGSSSRMGRSKQLLTIGDEPLLSHTVNTALASEANEVIVVLGSGYEKHRAAIEALPVEIAHHTGWHKGMGSSLKFGLSSLLEQHPQTDAVLILVCDQPYLDAAHLARIIDAYKATKTSIIASHYAGTVGVPVLFDRALFAELLAIGDDEGAKKIISSHRQQAFSIGFPEGATDLDTPDDYQQYLKKP